MPEKHGRTLADDLVPGQPFARDEALRIVSTLGRALQQLHAAGLVHGAVRPGNVLLADGGPPRLADVGRVERGVPRPHVANLSEAVADAFYLSPEQVVGERLDARSDIFALGAVGYLLVTGRHAFEAETVPQVLARVLHDRPRPPSQLVPDLAPGVDDVLGQALATARKDRYADVGALCDDLDEILAGRPPLYARRSPALEEAGQYREAALPPADPETNVTGARLKRRRSAARVAAAVTALGLVGGLELLRHELEAPDAAATGRPTVDAEQREGVEAPSEGLELPSLASTETAKLSLEFRHTLESGTLLVTVDGSTVLERRVTATIKRSLFGIKLREGRMREVIEVPSGRHEVAVTVSWDGEQRSERAAGTFAAGATRRLSARVGRIGKRLSLEWE